MKIHGLIWIAFGVFIWFYTDFIESRMVGDGSVTLFRWFALAFFVWGGIRLTMQYWMNKPKKEQVGPPPRTHHPQPGHGSPHQTHQHVRQPHGSHHQTHQHAKPHPHPSHHAHRQAMKRCSFCHHPIHAQAQRCQFCHNPA